MIHIGDPRFGQGIHPEEFVIEAVANLKRVTGTVAQKAMFDLYETAYGIYDHLSPGRVQRPLASVAHHDSEDTVTSGLLEQMVRVYLKKSIKELYGFNLEEFLDLPMDIVNLLIKVADEDQSKRTRIAHSVEQSLKNELKY